MYAKKNKRKLDNVSISALNVRDIICCVQLGHGSCGICPVQTQQCSSVSLNVDASQ